MLTHVVWYFLLLFKSVFEFGVDNSDLGFLGSPKRQFTSPIVWYCNPVTKKVVSLHLTSSCLSWFIHNFIYLLYYWVLSSASCFGSVLDEKQRHPSDLWGTVDIMTSFAVCDMVAELLATILLLLLRPMQFTIQNQGWEYILN